MIKMLRICISLFVLFISIDAHGAENKPNQAQENREMVQIDESHSRLIAQQNYIRDEIEKLKLEQRSLINAHGRQYNGLNTDLKSVRSINESLQEDIRSLRINYAEQSQRLQKELEFKTTAFFSAVFVIVLVFILASLYVRNQLKGTHLLEKIIEQDSALIAVLKKQMDAVLNIPELSVQDTSKEDHAFPVRVASEIYRMRKRIESMDDNTKGLNALKNALNRLDDDLNQRGYIINDLSGNPYIDELTVKIANTIERDDLESGSQIINRMIEPQIVFDGVVVGHGEVEIAVGVKK